MSYNTKVIPAFIFDNFSFFKTKQHIIMGTWLKKKKTTFCLKLSSLAQRADNIRKNKLVIRRWLFIKRYTKNLLASQNSSHDYFGASKLKYKIKVRENNYFLELNAFWYIHLFNKSLETKVNYFFNEMHNIKNIKITLQQEFSFPQAIFFLKLLDKRIRLNTQFLKHNKKFYNHFINIMPIIQTFYAIEQLAQQTAIELGRTKKH